MFGHRCTETDSFSMMQIMLSLVYIPHNYDEPITQCGVFTPGWVLTRSDMPCGYL